MCYVSNRDNNTHHTINNGYYKMKNYKENYDLTHLGFGTFKMGRVGCSMCVLTLPGDVFDIDQTFIINMAPFRRQIYLDARIDIATFWIPHRHHYPLWSDFIEDGIDTGTVLGTDTMQAEEWVFLPHWTTLPAAKPDWYVNGYLDIYNRFWRPKSNVNHDTVDDDWATARHGTISADDREFGYPAANLTSAIWTATVNKQLSSGDLDLDTSNDTLDITEIAKQAARVGSERERDFYSFYYKDVIERRGGKVSIDAAGDQRPRMIWHDTEYISGENIRGTDRESIGGLVGRGNATIRHRIPRKYIPEHGCLWTMYTLRFPPISSQETHYLIANLNDYRNMAADERVVAAEPVIDLDLNNFIDTAATTRIATIPYAHWYRMHPSYAKQTFEDKYGFTFIRGEPTADIGKNYYDIDTDDSNFQTTIFGHGVVSVKNNVQVSRMLPPASTSIYAGSNMK